MWFFLRVHIATCIFIIEIVCVLLDFTHTKKLVHRGYLEYVMNGCGSWFLMKGAPIGVQLGY